MPAKPAAAPAAAALTTAAPSVATPSPWILGARRDLGLLVGAPAWILPLLYVLGAVGGDRVVNDWVMSLGAIGHHLPGMLRAYGDRSLFSRFRVRFVLAPIGLAALCVALTIHGLHALVLLAFLWGVWHGMMQTYGFVRIYAAKAGATDRLAANLDLALLATWFLAAVVLSPLRLVFILKVGGLCGLPLPSVEALHGFRIAMIVATGLATMAWLAGTAWRWREGKRPGAVSVLLIVTSVGFWWFANVRVRHPLLGMPLFELFHDAQYLTIVWVFNQRRAELTRTGLSSVLRGLFRPTVPTVMLYVAAVAAYGAVALWQPGGQLGDTLVGLIAASQLLHFYFDGFIWKVREPSTAAALGVDARAAPPVRSSRARQAALWSLLLVPCLVLVVGEQNRSMSDRELALKVADLEPDFAGTTVAAAEVHWQEGDRDRAVTQLRHAHAIDPDFAPARDNLAASLCDLADASVSDGDAARTRELLDELARLRPGLSGKNAVAVDERLATYGHAAK